MCFFNDSSEERDVYWYFVPDDHKVIPFVHAFGSRVYDRDEQAQGIIGERFEPVTWRGGQPPCPEPADGLCGTEDQWKNGISIESESVDVWPGTNIPKCCKPPLVGACGGLAIGFKGFGVCHMDSTCDVYSPFGAAAPNATNVPCQFVSDFPTGNRILPSSTPAWTHYIDVAEAVVIIDGCNRTEPLNTINYNDGDEVRIPTGGAARYVVVWVTMCDTEGTTVKRVYLMRHAAG